MSQLNTDSRSAKASRRNARYGRGAVAATAPDRDASTTGFTLPVDLLELGDGFRDDGLGRRARAGLGEHVDDHPAIDDRPVRPVGRGRPRRQLPGLQDLLERLDARLDVPLRDLVERVQE